MMEKAFIEKYFWPMNLSGGKWQDNLIKKQFFMTMMSFGKLLNIFGQFYRDERKIVSRMNFRRPDFIKKWIKI